MSVTLATPVIHRVQLILYEHEIAEARQSGQDVKREGVSITLGPPTIARFQIPTMLWSWQEIVYDDSDATASGEQGVEPCYRSIRPLGNHFYKIDGTC